jgi:hypothetical protein
MGRWLKLGAAGLAFLLYVWVAAVRLRDEVTHRKTRRPRERPF